MARDEGTPSPAAGRSGAKATSGGGSDVVRERRLQFGEAVRERRIAAGLSQEALAERCGVDRKSISRVETGAFSPSLDRVWNLAAALDLTLDELFARMPDPGDGPPGLRRRRR